MALMTGSSRTEVEAVGGWRLPRKQRTVKPGMLHHRSVDSSESRGGVPSCRPASHSNQAAAQQLCQLAGLHTPQVVAVEAGSMYSRRASAGRGLAIWVMRPRPRRVGAAAAWAQRHCGPWAAPCTHMWPLGSTAVPVQHHAPTCGSTMHPPPGAGHQLACPGAAAACGPPLLPAAAAAAAAAAVWDAWGSIRTTRSPASRLSPWSTMT